MAHNHIKTVFIFFTSLFSVFPLLLTLLLLDYHVHSQSDKGPPPIPLMNFPFVNQMGFPQAYNHAQPFLPFNLGHSDFSNFITPFIPKGGRMRRLKDRPKDYNQKGQETTETVTEVECSNTMFMGPFHDPVYFGQNSAIYNRIDKSCKWSFLGTEPCIPMISCDTSKLTNGCDQEYLEIVDGGQGYFKVCAGNVPEIQNLTASGNLRDLYVHFKALKDGGAEPNRNLFRCKVICSQRTQQGKGGGNQLQKGFVPKVNPKCCESNYYINLN